MRAGSSPYEELADPRLYEKLADQRLAVVRKMGHRVESPSEDAAELRAGQVSVSSLAQGTLERRLGLTERLTMNSCDRWSFF
jgi:hypothetical protein